MDVEKLFQGIAVIFDDEINDPESTISKIKKIIQSKNIPVATYNEIPRTDLIPSLSNASFVVLDWDYTKTVLDGEVGERMLIPQELKSHQDENLIQFIREVSSSVFTPVFIFTSKPVDSIIDILRNSNLWNDEKRSRIFIKHKNEIDTETDFFKALEDWIKVMPSVYVLKEWEKNMLKSKDSMFIELYAHSPNWVRIIWNLLQKDAKDYHYEFGEFVTRNLNSRMGIYTFDEEILGKQKDVSSDGENSQDEEDSQDEDTDELGKELIHVIQGERYLSYHKQRDKQPEQAYTGDLYKVNKTYFLNIRAQCDLARDNPAGEYNPQLYCLQGKKLGNNAIAMEDITMKDGHLIFSPKMRISVEDLNEICKDKTKLEELNKNFKNHRSKVFLRNGAFLERNDKVIVGCIDGVPMIQFDLNIIIKSFSDVKSDRIGRLLPPYITRIQQKCVQHVVREGVMPMPKELFTKL